MRTLLIPQFSVWAWLLSIQWGRQVKQADSVCSLLCGNGEEGGYGNEDGGIVEWERGGGCSMQSQVSLHSIKA